jgi:hypothetical protein
VNKGVFQIDVSARPEHILKVLFLCSDYFGEEYICRVSNSSFMLYVRVLDKEAVINDQFEGQLVVEYMVIRMKRRSGEP